MVSISCHIILLIIILSNGDHIFINCISINTVKGTGIPRVYNTDSWLHNIIIGTVNYMSYVLLLITALPSPPRPFVLTANAQMINLATFVIISNCTIFQHDYHEIKIPMLEIICIS